MHPKVCGNLEAAFDRQRLVDSLFCYLEEILLDIRPHNNLALLGAYLHFRLREPGLAAFLHVAEIEEDGHYSQARADLLGLQPILAARVRVRSVVLTMAVL